jgi:hypothetical protein
MHCGRRRSWGYGTSIPHLRTWERRNRYHGLSLAQFLPRMVARMKSIASLLVTVLLAGAAHAQAVRVGSKIDTEG